jgi:hypothetical protein
MPERYEVFVADWGARRIVKLSSNEPNRATDVVIGFPAASLPGARTLEGNPFCLLFLDEKHLVVGTSGAPPELRLYELADAGHALSADGAKQKVAPDLPVNDSEAKFAEFIGLTRTRSNGSVADMLLATIRGVGVWKVPVRANVLGEMSRLESMPRFLDITPTVLTISEQGYLLTVDYNESSRSIKSRFVFLNPTNGQVVLGFDPGLVDVRGVTYSPKSGNLYAVATVYGKDEQGLFRLDDARQPGEREVTVTKLSDIREPTAMAFGPDGALYVTTLGDKSKDDDGALLKITGDL